MNVKIYPLAFLIGCLFVEVAAQSKLPDGDWHTVMGVVCGLTLVAFSLRMDFE